MKRIKLVPLIVTLLFMLVLSPLGWAKDEQTPAYKPGEILVKFKPNVSTAQIESLNKKLGNKIEGKIEKIDVRIIKLAKGADVLDEVEQYKKDSKVEYAEPNYIRRAFATTPNDPYYSYQWGLPKIKAPEAWDIERGSVSITIAMLDTGVDSTHPDLNDKIVSGWDFVNWDSNPADDNGHGTMTAGIAAAETNNAYGIAGVSWEAKIMPLKVLDAYGNGDDSVVAQAVQYAADHGAKIINMSLGGPGRTYTLEDAIDYAYSKGAILVAAAGNENTSIPYYPAAYNHVIGVSGTDSGDGRYTDSNWGYYIDVAAPAVQIFSTYPSGYATGTGTSASAPYVSGLAALLASRFPTLTNDEIEQRIESSADDLGAAGRDDYFGYGRINCFSAFVTSYPNGFLIKTSSSANVYLLEGGVRRWITSAASFSSHGFRWDRITTIVDPVMNNYSLGTSLQARPGTLIKGSAPNVYVTDLVGGVYQKRWLTNGTVFANLAYRWEDIITVSNEELSAYTSGSDVDSAPLYLNGTLLHDSSTGKVYLLEGGVRRWIVSPATFSSHGLRWDRIITIPAQEAAAYPEGAPLRARPGALLKGSAPQVYVTDQVSGVYQRRWITSADIFAAFRYHWEDIFAISDSELFSYTEGPNISL